MRTLRHYTQTRFGMDQLTRFVESCLADPDFRADGASWGRQDAVPTVEGATAFLARELQQVSATTYDVLFHPIKARTLVPFNASVNAGAETYAYDQWEGFGKAEFIHDYANDFPKVDVRKKRFSFPMRDIGDSYHYTLQDLRASQFAGQSIDTKRAQTARMVIEQKIDDLIAFGDAKHGIRGIAGQTDFTSVAPVTGSWTTATTALQLMGDLNKLVLAPELATKGLFKPDTLVLPLAVKPLLVAPWSTTADPTPIWKAWLATQGAEGIKGIEFWNKLDLANAGGTGGRALCYKKTNQVLEFLFSSDYEEFPQPSGGLIFEVKAKARLGGLCVHYPLATAYMDIQ